MLSDTEGMVEPIHLPPQTPQPTATNPSVDIHEIESFDLYWQVMLLHANKRLSKNFLWKN